MFFIESEIKDAPFYFAVEELFTRHHKKSRQAVIIWRTDDLVMIGNNQVVEAEVNTVFARELGLRVVRRSSGGGAIYTDLNTVQYTFIEPLENDAKSHMEKAAAVIIEILNDMGVPAKREGKNDILLDGKKITGLAQYVSGSHVCTHGSLLFDTNLDTLSKVLLPNEIKLRPKGISSIRSRVRNLKPYLNNDISVLDFMSILKDNILVDDVNNYMLNDDDSTFIKKVMQEKYENNDWNYRM